MFNNYDDYVEGFHDSSVDDCNVNILPKLPKVNALKQEPSCYEMVQDYFNTNSDKAASNAEPQAAPQPPDDVSQGKKGTENPICLQTKDFQSSSEGAEVLWPWLFTHKPQKQLFTKYQYLAMYLLGPDAPNPIRIVSYPRSSQRTILLYQNGLYHQVDQTGLRSFIKSFIPGEHREIKDIENVLYEINTEPATLTDDMVDCDEDIINFENGLLHLSTWELTEHTPDVISTIRIPCEFKPGLTLKDAPVFSSYLDDLTSGDTTDQTFLLEYIGAVLSNVPGYRFKKLLFLYGEGNSGKSQIRSLVEWLVGPQNNHTIDLEKLEARFGTSQLYGKRLVGSGDMKSAVVKEVSVLKELTGGDNINAEFKGKDAFTFRFKGFLWFNSNYLPRFLGDRGPHVYERFCFIRCGNVIPEEKRDSTLLDKMKTERAAIISTALRYFKAAVERGYKFTESESMICLRDECAEKNNSVIVFIKECCDTTQGRTKRSEVYRAYRAWCKQENMHEEPKSYFFKTLEEVFNLTAQKSGEYYLPLTLKPNIRLSFGSYR